MIWEIWVFLVLLVTAIVIRFTDPPRLLRRLDEENKAAAARNLEMIARTARAKARTAELKAAVEEIDRWTAQAEMLIAKHDETTDASERAKLKEEIDQCLVQARKHFVRRPEIRDIQARSDAAWARAFAERTGGTVPASRPLDHREAGGSGTAAELPNRLEMR